MSTASETGAVLPHTLRANILSSSEGSFVVGVYLIELGGGHGPRGTKGEVGGARGARRVREVRRSLTDCSMSRVLQRMINLINLQMTLYFSSLMS